MPTLNECTYKVGSSEVIGLFRGGADVAPLAGAIGLLRSKGGQLYMAGPANREASDGSGTDPDGIGTDPIGYVRNLAADELGTELLLGTSGESDATCTYVAGTDTVTATATPSGNGISLYIPAGLSAGALVEVTYTMVSVSSGTCMPIIYGTGCYAVLAYRSAPGTYKERVVLVAGGGFNNALRLRAGAATSSFVTSGHSVKEVRAAYQTTTAAKPKLVREPILGPELFPYGTFSADASGWALNKLRAEASVLGGEGVLTATLNDGGAQFCASNEFSLVTGKTYQYTWQARVGTATQARFSVKRGDAGGWVSYATTDFTNATMQQRGGTFVATGSDTICQMQFNLAASVGATAIFDNISVREILGYTDRYYWEFDGVDDRLIPVLPSGISTTQSFCICVAITPLRIVGATSDRYVKCFSSTKPTAQLRLAQASNDAGKLEFVLHDGSASRFRSAPITTLGVPHILTMWNTAAGMVCRMNGSPAGSTDATTQVSVVFNSMQLGGDAAGVNSANCRIQAPVIASGITTLAEVQAIERAVAQAAGVTLP